MTKQEKIKWLENASNDELLNQYKWTCYRIGKGEISEQVDTEESFELALAELKKRLDK